MPRDVAWAGAMPGGVDATSRAAARTPEGSSFMVSGEPRGGAHHAPPGAVKALSPKASGLNADATRAECGRGRHRSSGQPAQHVHGWLGQVQRVEVQPRRTASRVRSEEHTSELQSLMRISYAVFCLKKKNNNTTKNN